MPQALKIPDAKGAVDKEWGKMVVAADKSGTKEEVIEEARINGRKVHFVW